MAVRATMADLNAKVRLMIGDLASATQQFSEQQIQDALDRNRMDVRYEGLEAKPTFAPTGVQYLDYYSQWGYWESDVVVVNGTYATLTPASAELLLDTAHWTFPSGTGSGQVPPVFAVGKVFDIYATAADLLEYWAAVGSSDFDFTADGATFHASQVATARQTRAAYFRRQARPAFAKMVRSDVASHEHGDDPRRTALGPVSQDVPFITGD